MIACRRHAFDFRFLDFASNLLHENDHSPHAFFLGITVIMDLAMSARLRSNFKKSDPKPLMFD